MHWARAEMLKKIPVHPVTGVRFLSIEPLLESLGEIDLTGIHWVIVGGESGPGVFRYLDLGWVREIREQCFAQNVPFFYKQGSGAKPGMSRFFDGRLWEDFPKHASNVSFE